MDSYWIAPDDYRGFTVQARFGEGRTETSPSLKSESDAEKWVIEQQAEAAKRRARRLAA
jgi:hypothetical protein